MNNQSTHQHPLKSNQMASRTIYRGEKLNLRIDTLKMGNRPPAEKEIVEHRGSALIIPITAHCTVLLIKQWRPVTDSYMIELPSGTIENNETPEETAHRELREETGYSAAKLEYIDGIWPLSGYSEEYCHIFLATELKEDPLPQDKLEDIYVIETSIINLPKMIRNSEINDALTIAALTRALLLKSDSLDDWSALENITANNKPNGASNVQA